MQDMAKRIHGNMTKRLAAVAAPAFLALAVLSGASCPAAAAEPNVAKMICPAGKKAKQKLRLQETLARIADGGSPDAVVEAGKTALHLAAMAQNHLAICWLIAKGADLEAKDDEGKFFFDYIQAEGARAGVKSMCQQKMDGIAKATRRDWEMVIDRMNDEKAMQAMPSRFAPYMLAIAVRTGMDVNMKTEKGARWSVRKGMDSTLARLLLALGWQAEAPTPAQQLLYAVLRNDVKAAKNILKEHPGLLATEEYDLLVYVQSGTMLKALLAAGANIKARPAQVQFENQLVMDAINRGADKTAVEALLKAGAGIPLDANTQSTGLHYACGDTNVGSEMASVLVKGGADVNAQNTSGNTPLHVACIVGNLPMVEALLAIGADASIKNNEAHTPEQVIGKGIPVSAVLRERIVKALEKTHAKK